MGNEGVNACLGLRRIENELCFPAFLLHGKVMIYGYGPVWIQVGCGAHPVNGVIRGEHYRGNEQNRSQSSEEESPQPNPQIRNRKIAHAPDYMLPTAENPGTARLQPVPR
jgi:hypothetical protein